MKNLSVIIKSNMEMFERLFKPTDIITVQELKDRYKSHLLQSQKSLLSAICEDLAEMKRIEQGLSGDFIQYNIGYNQALSDIQSALNKIIKGD